MSRRSLWPASPWLGAPIAASDRPLAWWSQAQLSQFAAHIGPAWQSWCENWGLNPGPVDACNAVQLPVPFAGPGHWLPLLGTEPGMAWLRFPAGEPASVIVTLLFGLHLPEPAQPDASIAEEVAAKAVQALHGVLAECLSAGLPPYRPQAVAAAAEAPPRRDTRAWSGAVRVLARFGGTQQGVCLHLSSECAFALANADTVLRCREPSVSRGVAGLSP